MCFIYSMGRGKGQVSLKVMSKYRGWEIDNCL